MNQLKVRLAGPEDAHRIIEWINSNKGNGFDPGILLYPTLQTLCTYAEEPVAYLPTQRVLMLESVAPSPTAPDLVRAQALRDLVKGGELLASSYGIREIYFLGTDPAVMKIAVDHGFELVKHPVMRLKL